MRCPECRAAYGVTVRPEGFAGDPVCAFLEDGSFTTDNWQCGTMNELRKHSEEGEWYSDDNRASVLPVLDGCQGEFLVLCWYKNRGRTDQAIVIDTDTVKVATLESASRCLQGLRNWKGRQT